MKRTADFNEGYWCNKCGVFDKPKERKHKGKGILTCPTCAGTFYSKWTKPLNQRIGRCSNCGGSEFKSAIYKHDLLRCCKTCSEVFNIDKNKVKRPGKKEFKC